jgi:hypothetical protein
MSILDSDSEILIDKTIIVASNIKEATKQTFQIMVNAFNTGSKMFWNNPDATPLEIAQALGSDAREVFELHYALGLLVNSIKPERIQEGWGVIGQFTMNEDGTVTIIEPTTTTTTTPEPT